MTRALLMTTLLLAGCPKKAPGGSSLAGQLAGTWHDEGGTELTFVRDGSTLRVARIIDSDGEAFPVRGAEQRSEGFWFSYNVPSTGYVVDILVTGVDGDVAHTLWSNDHDASGTEDMYRQR